MQIKRFEDLECWQAARSLARYLYIYTKRPDFSKDQRLSEKMIAASIEIMKDISEGFNSRSKPDSRSKPEFLRFLTHSRRACAEVQNCLYLALDQKYISEDEFAAIYGRCEKLLKIIEGLIRYLKRSLAISFWPLFARSAE
jgi:four helix bundle protein